MSWPLSSSIVKRVSLSYSSDQTKKTKSVLYSNSFICLKDIFSKVVIWVSAMFFPKYLFLKIIFWMTVPSSGCLLHFGPYNQLLHHMRVRLGVCSVPLTVSMLVSHSIGNASQSWVTRTHSSLSFVNIFLLTPRVMFPGKLGTFSSEVRKKCTWFWAWTEDWLQLKQGWWEPLTLPEGQHRSKCVLCIIMLLLWTMRLSPFSGTESWDRKKAEVMFSPGSVGTHPIQSPIQKQRIPALLVMTFSVSNVFCSPPTELRHPRGEGTAEWVWHTSIHLCKLSHKVP